MQSPRSHRAALGGAFLVALLGVTARGAAPPRGLDGPRQRELERLVFLSGLSAGAGRFAEAAEREEERHRLCVKWLGREHYTTVSSRHQAAELRTISKAPPAQQAAMKKAMLGLSQAVVFKKRFKYRENAELQREALAVRRAVLGEKATYTASSYNNLALAVQELGNLEEAEGYFRRAIDIWIAVVGEAHPNTANSYGNLATNLTQRGRYAEAERYGRKSFEIDSRLYGPEDVSIAIACNNLAFLLEAQGHFDQAATLFRRAVDIGVKRWGEGHENTGIFLGNLAMAVKGQGRLGEAEALIRKVVAADAKRSPVPDAGSALHFNNLAVVLDALGRFGEAEPFHRQALSIREKELGELHHLTAAGVNNLANNLHSQDKNEEAEKLFRRSLAIRRSPKVHGEIHTTTAAGHLNLAAILHARGKYPEAESHLRSAVAIREKVLPGSHPDLALCYGNLAVLLNARDKHAEAEPLARKAYALRMKVLGSSHPATAFACVNLANTLFARSKDAEAVRLLQGAILDLEGARIAVAESGFDRAVAAGQISPHLLLALGLLRFEQPRAAFAHLEASLARGLLDDLSGPSSEEANRALSLRSQLRVLDQKLGLYLSVPKLKPDYEAVRDELLRRRRETAGRLAALAAEDSARQLLPLERIQRQIPRDGAIVAWVEVPQMKRHYACVVRAGGDPVWVPLPGSGKGGRWTDEDLGIAERLHRSLQQRTPDAFQAALRKAFHDLRIAPLKPHLRGVGRLFVVPTGFVAKVPLEAVADEFRISYVPSGSMFARLLERHRPLSGASLLAVGDPVYAAPAGKDAKPLRAAYEPLPGTRIEVESLLRLAGVGRKTALLGAKADERELEAMNASGRLKRYRLLHFATHGSVDYQTPGASALILSRDALPDAEKQALRGEKIYTGELTVAAIRQGWRLDADLVVLSACETALGRATGGEGLVGFAHAFLSRGARCVVLSRWKVEDGPTALLMLRFYENLLGSRPGTKSMGRAASLEEARGWLRRLSREEAEGYAALHAAGRLRGTVKDDPPPAAGPRPKLPAGDRPYDKPRFWAAFVLIGDPD